MNAASATATNDGSYSNYNICLVVNHDQDLVQKFGETLVIFWRYNGSANIYEAKEILMSDFVLLEGGLSYQIVSVLQPNRPGIIDFCLAYADPEMRTSSKRQTYYMPGRREGSIPYGFVRITNWIPIDFYAAYYDPAECAKAVRLRVDSSGKRYIAGSPINGDGVWHLSHQVSLNNGGQGIVYLWRCEIPAFFEMHSHIESNRCAPLPAAWVNAQNASGFVRIFSPTPSYATQGNWLARREFAGGEFVNIARRPTAWIGSKFLADFVEMQTQSIFPFVSARAERFGCLMPMDMEYMHYDGYYGVPVVQFTIQDDEEPVAWYCWNSIWGGNPSGDEYQRPTPSSRNEVWCAMPRDDSAAYEGWGEQKSVNESIFIGCENSISNARDPATASQSAVRALSFFHFDPRRYTQQAKELETTGWELNDVLETLIQSGSFKSYNAIHFGVKTYTALGWAPMDPFLRDPLEAFYAACEADQIPVLNHCTPAGFPTHDRHHYYDLLKSDGKVVEGLEDEMTDGWCSKFAQIVPGPGQLHVIPSDTPDPGSRRSQESLQRIWWFTHHYASPQAWKKVLAKYPKLKLCLAHFGDSEHLRDSSDERSKREPPHFAAERVTLGFSGDKIDPMKTHRYLYDLLEIIQSDNRVFADLSYVILDEGNADLFTELFDWAREHKPILLERILWGTDWPFTALEGNVKSFLGGHKKNVLDAFAKSFRYALPNMPPDFYLRACFLNPLQYLNMRQIRASLLMGGAPNQWNWFGEGGGAGLWSWIDELDVNIFDIEYTGDKAKLFYHNCSDIGQQPS